MKNKKGFTLIELLAVISIIAIISVLTIPKIINQIKLNKENVLDSNKSLIISSARNYVLDYNLEEPLSISLSDLCDLDYIKCPITNPVNDSTMNGWVNIDADKVYTYSEDDATYWLHPVLTVNLDGGTTTQTFSATYLQGKQITLIDPTKANGEFIEWSVSGEGSSINGDVLTIGTGNTTITANWDMDSVVLTVNLDGGTTPQTFDPEYIPGTQIILVSPLRSGHVFTGWSVSGAGASLNSNQLTIGTSNTTLTANWLSFANMFTYTVGGSPGVSGTDYSIIDDTDGNWRIKFLTTGVFRPLINMTIDAFLVGGGGGGNGGGSGSKSNSGGGGGGGTTNTATRISLTANTAYPIVIGAGGAGANYSGGTGGTSSAFGQTATGGTPNTYRYRGNHGGSGGGGGAQGYNAPGVGGSDGSNGITGNFTGGTGQAYSTREFGESTGTLYAGGGGAGGGPYSASPGGAAGGAGGGANGGATRGGTGGTAAANTGGGGGGGGAKDGTSDLKNGGAGGSGIVVIRNTKINEVGNTTKFNFSYDGVFVVVDGNTDNWRIKFISDGTFTPLSSTTIDAFLVGGGGGGNGGGSGTTSNSGGGGSGGRTATYSNISITSGTDYSIVLGLGGSGGNYDGGVGGTTSAFSYTATGGATASYRFYGNNGGSGGGGGAQGYNAPGVGGSDGSNGITGNFSGGTGQGTSTREFGEVGGTLYAGGGGAGGGPYNASPSGAAGGAGGGASGGANHGGTGGTALANTGGGGGGGGALDGSADLKNGGSGGSGIVVIRAS